MLGPTLSVGPGTTGPRGRKNRETPPGQTRVFDDDETTHEYGHGWSPGNDDEARMIDHIGLMMAEITHLLEAL